MQFGAILGLLAINWSVVILFVVAIAEQLGNQGVREIRLTMMGYERVSILDLVDRLNGSS
jgi:hypothetical protein